MPQTEAILKEFREIAMQPIPPGLAEFKSQGGRAVGYFCSYTPPEILTAAGLWPVRLRGAGSTDSGAADIWMSHLTCSFVRHTVAQALNGAYDLLDGVIAANTCDHVRRAADVLAQKSKLKFHGFLSVPRSTRDTLFPWYWEELERLRQDLATHFKTEISDAALAAAASSHREVRELLRAVDDLRATEPPRLTGSEMLSLLIAAQTLPPEVFLTKARPLPVALIQRELNRDFRARLILTGGALDDLDLVETVESQGALIVGDQLCFGARGLSRPEVAADNTPPLEKLARTYLYQTPCPRMMADFPVRFSALKKAYDARRADGVIFLRLKFCQIWGSEAHNLKHQCREAGIPILILDREYNITAVGQLRTRVQAFLEQLGK